MVELKIVIADQKEGRCYQKSLSEEDSKTFYGKKISETFNGELIDLPGYELKITGGSDISGFPMRWDVDLAGIKRILAVEGIGLKKTRKGMKKRKTVAGNTVSDRIVQLNVVSTKYGDKSLKDHFNPEQPAEPNADQQSEGQAPEKKD